MEKILVPVDFSDFAERALEYAVIIAERTQSEIVLAHAVVPHIPPGSNQHFYDLSINKQTQQAEEKLAGLVAKHQSKSAPFSLDYVIEKDTPSDAIADWTKKVKPFLIVMGTQGASGLEKVMFGSVTTEVMNKVSCPLLVIPEATVIKPFQKITYATEFDSRDAETLELVTELAARFSAKVNCLHISTDVEDLYKAQDKIKVLRDRFEDDNVNFEIISSTKSFDEELDTCLENRDIDLLVMLTHERNFFERLFDHGKTREVAFRTNTPLLIFKRRKK